MSLLSLQVDWDMNGDGMVTITDIWLLEKWLLCLPGNLALELLQRGLPGVARFLEIQASAATSYDSFYGIVAWTLSLGTWIVAWLLLSALLRAWLEPAA